MGVGDENNVRVWNVFEAQPGVFLAFDDEKPVRENRVNEQITGCQLNQER